MERNRDLDDEHEDRTRQRADGLLARRAERNEDRDDLDRDGASVNPDRPPPPAEGFRPERRPTSGSDRPSLSDPPDRSSDRDGSDRATFLDRPDRDDRIDRPPVADRPPVSRDQRNEDRSGSSDGDRRPDREHRIMTDDDIEVITGGEDLGVFRARRRFGGFDLAAAIAGLLAAVGMTALLGGLAGGIGTVGYQLDVQRDNTVLSTGGFIAGLVVLVLSFLVGGWVAGRVSRYDGGVNGFASAAFFVLLSAILAGLGAALGDEYNVFANIRLPQWFTSEATTGAALLSAIVALAVVLAAGFLGGTVGARYHRKADAYLAEYAGANAAKMTRAAITGESDRVRRPKGRSLLNR